MSSDFNLVRAHFESALATLDQLKDFTSQQDTTHLLEVATLAYGAGARRLRRMGHTPWAGSELVELHQLEERVRRTLARAEIENLTRPHFLTPAAQ